MLNRLRAMNGHSVDREPVQTDVQQILAYLEELGRLRTLVHLHQRSEPPLTLSARVELVNDQQDTFSLSFPHQVPRLEPGEMVDLHFPLAGMRFQAETRFLDRGCYMQSVFHLPGGVMFADRRHAMRTRIGSREKAGAAVFETLFEGMAASGRLLNLSMEGLCLRVERTMQVQGNKRLAPHADHFHTGQKLQIVRILNLPHLPTLECSGEVRFSMMAQGGPLLLGIHLEGLGTVEAKSLHQFMLRRLPTFGRAFPVRRRRGAAEEVEDAEGQEDEAAAAAEAPEQELLDEPSAHALEESATPLEDRLIRLRRRGKRFLVIVADDLDRSILICSLQVCGFPLSFEARNLVQGLEWSKKGQIDAIILDQQIGPMTGLEVAKRLRKMGRLDGVPIFQIMEAPDVRSLLAAKAAGVSHVVKQPIDFDGELKSLLDHTFGLMKQ